MCKFWRSMCKFWRSCVKIEEIVEFLWNTWCAGGASPFILYRKFHKISVKNCFGGDRVTYSPSIVHGYSHLPMVAGITKWKAFLGTFYLCFSSTSFGIPSMRLFPISSDILDMPFDIPDMFPMPSRHAQIRLSQWAWDIPRPKNRSDHTAL